MDRDYGAQRALAFVRRTDFAPSGKSLSRQGDEGACMGPGPLGRRPSPHRGHREIPEIGVGMLGYAFMGKAHTNAYKTLAYMTWPPPLMPSSCRSPAATLAAVSAAAARVPIRRTGRYRLARARRRSARSASSTTEGRTTMHAEPTDRRRPGNGKHVPVREASWPHGPGRALRDLAAGGGNGRETHVRLQLPLRAGGAHGARDDRRRASSARSATSAAATYRTGVPILRRSTRGGSPFRRGRVGAHWATSGAHVIDLARFLVGEVAAVSSIASTFIPGPPGPDDVIEAAVQFKQGAVGHDRGDTARPRAPQSRPPVRDQRHQKGQSPSTSSASGSSRSTAPTAATRSLPRP